MRSTFVSFLSVARALGLVGVGLDMRAASIGGPQPGRRERNRAAPPSWSRRLKLRRRRRRANGGRS